jgi:hypothetical protein
MANDEIRIVFLPPAYSRPYMVVETAVEPTTGIEPVDLFLTKEALYRLSYVGIIRDIPTNAFFVPLIFWSGRRDSNSRQPAWKAEALPTELLPLLTMQWT